MGNRLENKVAVITGGTSGIGAATAELFVAEGAKVVFNGRSEKKGAALADRLGESAVFITGDVTRESDIKAVIEKAVDRFGRLDVLFNNAGAGSAVTLETITPGQIDESVHLLLTSTMLGVKHAIAPMKAAGGGAIINNSSIAAIRHNQGSFLYSAIKAAVTHYTKMAGVALGEHRIRVNAISPGAIATPIFWGGSARDNTMTAEHSAKSMAKLQRGLAKATPIPDSGLASDIAEAALYLASDAGRFVNCHDLVVDGGRTSLFREGA